MIRVTKSEQENRTIITVDGQLAGENIDVVELLCNQTLSEGKPLNVVLRDVLPIGEAGRVFLRRLAARGIRLLARGITSTVIGSVESRMQIWSKDRVLHLPPEQRHS
jgi:hypothetical protein